jgi:transcriptional regulator with XRE-family HTH domain
LWKTHQKRYKILRKGDKVVLVKLGEKLAELLAQRHQSRRSLATSIDLPENTVNDLVNKHYEPGVFRALALARALGVSLDWLADDDQGLPPVPAGETLGFVRLLSPDELKRLDDYLRVYKRDVVLAAAVRMLCGADQGAAGSALNPKALALDKLAVRAKVAGAVAAISPGAKRDRDGRGNREKSGGSAVPPASAS